MLAYFGLLNSASGPKIVDLGVDTAPSYPKTHDTIRYLTEPRPLHKKKG